MILLRTKQSNTPESLNEAYPSLLPKSYSGKILCPSLAVLVSARDIYFTLLLKVTSVDMPRVQRRRHSNGKFIERNGFGAIWQLALNTTVQKSRHISQELVCHQVGALRIWNLKQRGQAMLRCCEFMNNFCWMVLASLFPERYLIAYLKSLNQ
jgi:hypothetical protein